MNAIAPVDGLNCPTCRTPLTMAERQGVEIDYCPRCRGVWLDRGELDKIIERVEKQPLQTYATEPPDGYDVSRSGHGGRHDSSSKHRGYGYGRSKSWLKDLFD